MSYAAVNKLSAEARDNAFYEFNSEEEAKHFELPFSGLKSNDKVVINGCKKIWTVCSIHSNNRFYLCKKFHVQGTVTIKDANGFYASIRREDIERIIKDDKDEELFRNNGQLSLF